MPDERDYSLGKLYNSIKQEHVVQDEDFKPQKLEEHKYVLLCRKLASYAPQLGKGAKYTEDLQSQISFLDWKLTAPEYDSATKFVAILGIFGVIIFTILTYIGFYLLSTFVPSIAEAEISSGIIILAAVSLFSLIFGGIIYYFMKYPSFVVSKEQRFALAYLPSIVGYMTMSLKLVPNLERAVKFAALQGKGKLAEDLKKLIWEVNIGVHSTVSEGLDLLAYKWKKYSSEFKEAMMMIKSSMVEDSDARRAELLDKTVDIVLESIKIKMEGYARSLSQPSLILFYVGILLPLLLVIILPIGSTFAKMPFANPIVLALLYDVSLPLFVFLYAKSVLNSVPTVYAPPAIPDAYPGLPRKGYMFFGKMQFNINVFVGIVFVIGILLSIFAQLQFGITMQKVMQIENMPQKYIDNPDEYFNYLAEQALLSKGKFTGRESALFITEYKTQKLLFTMQPGHDITPYFIIYGFAITLSVCIFLFFFFNSFYKKKIQDYYVNMETEFKEILYILASRLGEGKPMEDALVSTRDFFSDLTISKDLLAKTADNLNLLGMPIEQALFDPTFGSLKHNPSLIIKNNFKLIVDAVALGVITGSKATLSIIMQIRNTDEIRELIKKVTMDITQMMNTMATLIAPAVLGITSSMQKIVVLTLNSLASSGMSQTSTSALENTNIGALGNLNMNSLTGSFDIQSIAGMATPAVFNIIIIIYVVLLVIVLSYFTSKLQEDNPLETQMLIAYTVPIAVVIYIVAAFASSLLLGGGFGG